jgi:hypothetical protein
MERKARGNEASVYVIVTAVNSANLSFSFLTEGRREEKDKVF